MKTILHIGTNKTGSSSIQESFAAGAAKFSENGIYYPVLDKFVHHTQLSFCFTEPDEMIGIFGRTDNEKIKLSEENAERYWKIIYTDLEGNSYKYFVLKLESGAYSAC